MKIELTRIEDWDIKRHNCSQVAYDSNTTELYNTSESLAMSDLQKNNPYESDSTEICDQPTKETTKTSNKNTQENNLNEIVDYLYRDL